LEGIQSKELSKNRERDCLDISASDNPREERMERIVAETVFGDRLEGEGIGRLVQAEAGLVEWKN
jgi:hypothetical protein